MAELSREIDIPLDQNLLAYRSAKLVRRVTCLDERIPPSQPKMRIPITLSDPRRRSERGTPRGLAVVSVSEARDFAEDFGLCDHDSS